MTGQSNLIHDMRTRIKVEDYGLENHAATDFPGTYEGYDDTWNLENFKRNFQIKIQSISRDKMEMEFDMIGCDASLANAFRRILLAEIPTMAIEKVYMYNNTSVIQDEILAHRIGLIPLKANPDKFKYRENMEDEETEENTLEYELKIKCKLPKDAKKGDKAAYIDSKVLTSHIEWIPIGNQAEHFKAEDVNPIHPDILINKLNPGQELDMRLKAVKGIGKDHAKFSPVATAFYRLLTEIRLKRDFYDEEAEKLQSCFTPGVIELVADEASGRRKAAVANPRLDLCSRQIFMHDEFKDQVEVFKVRDHFIFSIESTGAITAEDLFKKSVSTLMQKSENLLNMMSCETNK